MTDVPAGLEDDDMPRFLARGVKRSVRVTEADLLEAAAFWPETPPDELKARIEHERWILTYRDDLEERVRRERAALGLPEMMVLLMNQNRDVIGTRAATEEELAERRREDAERVPSWRAPRWTGARRSPADATRVTP